MKKMFVVLLVIAMIVIPAESAYANNRDYVFSDGDICFTIQLENVNNMARSYTGEQPVAITITDQQSGDSIGAIAGSYKYEYADGLWAMVTSADITAYSNSGYTVSKAYGWQTAMASDYGMAYCYFDIKRQSTGAESKYKLCMYCDIYGECWVSMFKV